MKNKKQNKTWRLIYPDKTESISNFNPLEHEREKVFEEFEIKIKENIRGLKLAKTCKGIDLGKTDSQIHILNYTLKELKKKLKNEQN